MPRQTRSSRSRSRPRRPTPPRGAPATLAAPAPADDAIGAGTAPPVARPAARTTVIRPQATPGSLSRGFVTDYAYIIGELKRIVLLTAALTALLLILWVVIG